MQPEEIDSKFSKLSPPLLNYRDASYNPCSYECSVLDCWKSFKFSIEAKIFDFYQFDLGAYDFYSKMENGDMTWMIDKKILAFASPSNKSYSKEGVN
jgi:cell division cycle 14